MQTKTSLPRRLGMLWFGFSAPVDRGAYAATGFALMGFKYATDAALLWAVTGELWTARDYLTPLLATRADLVDRSGWLLGLLFLWALPFVWVGASMTFRRALDAGLSAWTGLLFFVPMVNYLWMLLLCLLPTRTPRARPASPPDPRNSAMRILAAAMPAVALGVALMCASVFGFASYGATLFVGAPFVMGFVAASRINRDADRGAAQTVASGWLALLIAGGALLLFALEGVVCLAMALPPAAVLALLGAILGRMVAGRHRLGASHATLLLLTLPFLMGAEAAGPGAPVREVVSIVEIDATPEIVWPRVVGFTELPPPRELVFALGIAYPMRARIDGAGVGATRLCEFSTGPFVEPITVWDAPHRLGFDVTAQPDPMQETSLYRSIHAPHLIDGLQARRGEFRLVALPGGRTRLEGSTWYSVEMAPQAYWALLSDALIHAIHGRVLAHVKALAEADAATLGDPS